MTIRPRPTLPSYPDSGEVAHEASRVAVMIVDDDESSRKGMLLAMRDLGYPAVAASDGLEALELYEKRPVDIIISDWTMPRMNGAELCRRIRKAPDRYVYFILTTAHADKSHLVEGMEAGADDFLAKPVDFDELSARLISAKRVIGLHRALAKRNRSLRRDSQQYFKAARIDPLTSVRNRLALMEDLEELSERSKNEGLRVWLAMLDVDQFKLYNDEFGHLAGDEVLQKVCGAIDQHLRKSDALYRYGGEEFVVTLLDQTRETALIATERVRRAVEALGLEQAKGASWPVVTVSAGLAELDGRTVADALQEADAALYRAKGGGRNRIES
jgi:diguanylate cyclase (GGDEF)-like protein